MPYLYLNSVRTWHMHFACALADADLSVFALSLSPRYSRTWTCWSGLLLLLVMVNTPALLFTVWSSWNADLHKYIAHTK